MSMAPARVGASVGVSSMAPARGATTMIREAGSFLQGRAVNPASYEVTIVRPMA